ncbi:MAG TPA: response regulator [Bryobacteraceae bacterium]|nr:response regulator [Bryobacteraceae bacterium]
MTPNHHHEVSVSALLVGAFERDRQLIQEIFRKTGWCLYEAHDRHRALNFLDRYPIQVVIAETDLDGWSWKKVLLDLQNREQPPQLIVTSRHADDRLWAEALNMGAFDVLAQPFERKEVERAVESAHRHVLVQPGRATHADTTLKRQTQKDELGLLQASRQVSAA